MTILFNPIVLPDEFLNLLKIHLMAKDNYIDEICKSFSPDSVIPIIFSNTFSQQGQKKELKDLIKTLGWLHFRDRVSSLFLNKIKNGFYPYNIDSSELDDILSLEKRLEPFTMQSISRSYLLGFYLTMDSLNHNRGMRKVPEKVFNLLKLSKVRSEKIDLIVIVLWLFIDLIPENKLNKAFGDAKISYAEIFDLLSPEDKKFFNQNIFNYLFSIKEKSLFKFGEGLV